MALASLLVPTGAFARSTGAIYGLTRTTILDGWRGLINGYQILLTGAQYSFRLRAPVGQARAPVRDFQRINQIG